MAEKWKFWSNFGKQREEKSLNDLQSVNNFQQHTKFGGQSSLSKAFTVNGLDSEGKSQGIIKCVYLQQLPCHKKSLF